MTKRRAFESALLASELSHSGRLVGLVLRAHMGRDGRASITVATLAAGAGMSTRHVRRAVRELARAGLLGVVRPAGGSSTYFATPPAPPEDLPA